MSEHELADLENELAAKGYALRLAGAADLDGVRGLMESYFAELKLDHDPANLDKDLADPLQEYGGGGLILLIQHGTPAGCVGVRELGPGEAELKRMFIPGPQRGKGLGKALLQAAISLARSRGFTQLVLDTRLDLVSANRLYESHGFEDIADYNQNPRAERFMRLKL